MLMENFTPLSALLGGVLIGLSATVLLVFHGRIAGITGIVSTALDPRSPKGERTWRLLFLGGLLSGALVLSFLLPQNFTFGITRSTPVLLLAGALVGLGTRIGSGCTSGHGVCGISRGSRRSLAATVTFISTGALSVLLFRTFSGGL